MGGSAPCVLNAANEVVNLAFRQGRCKFLQMADVIEQTLSKVDLVAQPTIEDYLQIDKASRVIAQELLK